MTPRLRLYSLASLILLPGMIAAQGALEPPGAPGPSMVTLDQLNDAIAAPRPDAGRTPINPAQLPITISSPGSYYLTGGYQAGFTDQTAITITAPNVTIDLNGYTLQGPGKDAATSNFPSGIDVQENYTTILNGTVTEWPGSGIKVGASGIGMHVSRVHAINNKANGIQAGQDSIVQSCLASTNGATGIRGSAAALIADCTARNNTQDGIYADVSSRVRDCLSISNGQDGFDVGQLSIVTNCVSRLNQTGFSGLGDGVQFIQCSATSNTGNGFAPGGNGRLIGCSSIENGANGLIFNSNLKIEVHDSLIAGNTQSGISAANSNGSHYSNCTVRDNGTHGIDAGFAAMVVDNQVAFNGGGAGITDGTAIRVGNRSTVLRNRCGGSDIGLVSTSTFCYFSQNYLTNNTTHESLGGATEGAGDLANVIY